MVKRLPAMWEAQVQSLGREDPLEKGMAIHSSTIAWRIPWTEEPGRLQSMGSQRVGHDWATSLIALFIIYWLFFISSRSLLNLSCIFSILVSRICICNSFLFSRFWIIFPIIIQNSLSGRFLISSSFVWFGGHLSCFFTWGVFLCLFILFILLCLGSPFCILAVCGVLFIMEFPYCEWGCISGLSRFLG